MKAVPGAEGSLEWGMAHYTLDGAMMVATGTNAREK